MKVDMRGAIYGMAIGDGYVASREGKGHTLSVQHGPQQQAYCEWKARLLSRALGGKKVTVNKGRTGPGGKYECYRFSKNDNYFKQVRRNVYPNGHKERTLRVLDMLGPLGLAIWYMDDGSARRNVNKDGFVSSVSTNIAICCGENEANLVRDWFRERHQIEWKVFRRSGQCPDDKAYMIQCNTHNSRKFAALIAPHVPTCMLYKLAHVADLTSQERQTLAGTCSECEASLYGSPRRGGLCGKCYSRAYNEKNKERIAQRRRDRYQADPEKHRTKLKAWRDSKRVKI